MRWSEIRSEIIISCSEIRISHKMSCIVYFWERKTQDYTKKLKIIPKNSKKLKSFRMLVWCEVLDTTETRQVHRGVQRWNFVWESITQPVLGRKNSRSHRKISKNSRRLSGKCGAGYLLPLVQTSFYWPSEMRILMRIDNTARAWAKKLKISP